MEPSGSWSTFGRRRAQMPSTASDTRITCGSRAPSRPIRRESVVGSGVHRARTAREEGSRGHPGTAAAGQGEGVRRRTKYVVMTLTALSGRARPAVAGPPGAPSGEDINTVYALFNVFIPPTAATTLLSCMIVGRYARFLDAPATADDRARLTRGVGGIDLAGPPPAAFRVDVLRSGRPAPRPVQWV